MLLLGVLAAQAEAAPAGAGAYDLLESEILTASQASIEFTSLDTKYSANYETLEIRMTGRTTRADNLDWLYLQISGDTSANYTTHRWIAEITSAGSNPYVSQTSQVRAAYFAGNNADTDSVGVAVMQINDAFNTNKLTTTRTWTGHTNGAADDIIAYFAGLHDSSSAVSSLKLESLNGASFVTGCRFSLYGYRKVAV